MGGAFMFSVGVHRQGALLRTAPASVTSCVEEALWQAVLTGALPNGMFPKPTVEPIWAASGQPAVSGVRVTIPGGLTRTYDTRVFRHRAHAVIRDLLLAKELAVDDVVDWAVEATPEPPSRFRCVPSRARYPMEAAVLDHVPVGTLAITIAPRVLEEIRAQVLALPGRECAGVLAGRLAHDAARGAALLSITAQLPVAAGAGGASQTHFAFGPNSFQAARRGLASMDGGTVMAGWFHSHPACAECPRNPTCQAHTVFFSSDDIRVHASAFPDAYAVALVAGKVRDRGATDPGFGLYAWHQGRVAECTLEAATLPGGNDTVFVAHVGPGMDAQAHSQQQADEATVRVTPDL